MADFQGPNMPASWYADMGAKLDEILAGPRLGPFTTEELVAEAHKPLPLYHHRRGVDFGPPYLVLMEDEPVHTDEHPFCSDPICECRYDEELLREYVYGPMERGELTKAEAARLRWNEQL